MTSDSVNLIFFGRNLDKFWRPVAHYLAMRVGTSTEAAGAPPKATWWVPQSVRTVVGIFKRKFEFKIIKIGSRMQSDAGAFQLPKNRPRDAVVSLMTSCGALDEITTQSDVRRTVASRHASRCVHATIGNNQ